MKDKDILKLLRMGMYRVDIDTGTLYGQRGRAVPPFEKDGRLFVRLYFDGDMRRVITLARLVWMAATMRIIPKGFEVHHDDRNIRNNAFSNLYCLHEMDHAKLHGRSLVEEPIPF